MFRWSSPPPLSRLVGHVGADVAVLDVLLGVLLVDHIGQEVLLLRGQLRPRVVADVEVQGVQQVLHLLLALLGVVGVVDRLDLAVGRAELLVEQHGHPDDQDDEQGDERLACTHGCSFLTKLLAIQSRLTGRMPQASSPTCNCLPWIRWSLLWVCPCSSQRPSLGSRYCV